MLQAAAPTIGIVGAFVCIVMLASPLATVRDVLATKSTASMPFAMTVAGFLNACSWAAYGLVVVSANRSVGNTPPPLFLSLSPPIAH